MSIFKLLTKGQHIGHKFNDIKCGRDRLACNQTNCLTVLDLFKSVLSGFMWVSATGKLSPRTLHIPCMEFKADM